MNSLVAKVKKHYAQGGIKAVWRKAIHRVSDPIPWQWKRWYRTDNELLGKIVELRGNKSKLNGLVFFVDNPRITTRLKSRFFRGDYEKAEREMLPRHLDPKLATVEIGGCIGVVACVTNRLLTDPRKHVVVEANPYLIPSLEANRDQNHCRFRVLNRALAYGKDQVEFSLHEYFTAGALQQRTSELVSVDTMTLGRLLEDERFGPINLVFDAEGAEVDLLEHEAEVMRNSVARLIIELHGRMVGNDAIKRVVERLGELGFICVEGDPEAHSSTQVFYNQALVDIPALSPH